MAQKEPQIGDIYFHSDCPPIYLYRVTEKPRNNGWNCESISSGNICWTHKDSDDLVFLTDNKLYSILLGLDKPN